MVSDIPNQAFATRYCISGWLDIGSDGPCAGSDQHNFTMDGVQPFSVVPGKGGWLMVESEGGTERRIYPRVHSSHAR